MNEQTPQNEEQLTRMVEPDIIKMGVIPRLLNIFVSPGELMQNIKTYPIISVPLIASIIIGLVSIPILQQSAELMNQQLSNISIERFGIDLMNPVVDEYGDAIATIMDTAVLVGLVAAAFFGPLIMTALSTVGFWILCKIAGGQATFAQLFSMNLHIYVFAALTTGLIVQTLMVLTGNFLDMTSLAAVIMPGGDISMVAFNIFSAISIFTVWIAILNFIGIKTINDFSGVRAGVITVIAFSAGIAIHVGTLMSTFIIWDLTMGGF